MSRPVLLGVDSGQTVGKAALYDLEGHEIAVASAANAVTSPRPRWVERDMEEVWRQVAAAIRQALAAAGDVEVRGVGICGHGDGAYLVGEDLTPVRPAILATDSRAYEYAARTADGGVATQALALTGQVPFAASPASVLAWVRDHEPDAYAATRWTLFCKDWLRLRLTGSIATDPTEASASFTDVHAQDWSDTALRLYGLADLAPRLPPIHGSAAIAGAVTADAAALTGLPRETPVVTGAHDVDATAIGIGAAQPGSASMVLGTFSINQIVADKPVSDVRWQARTFARPGQWLHMSTSPAGAANLDWAARRIGPWRPDGEPDPAAAVREATTSHGHAEPGTDDAPLFLPFLYGAPHGAAVPGAWVGIRGWHERGDLLHAVLEGVAFNHRTHLDALREAFAVTSPVRVGGGGARSPEWTQLLADAIDLPMEVTDAAEAGTRGAAMLAGIGVGVYSGVEDAVERCVRVIRRIDPDPVAARHLQRRYARYRRIVEILGGL